MNTLSQIVNLLKNLREIFPFLGIMKCRKAQSVSRSGSLSHGNSNMILLCISHGFKPCKGQTSMLCEVLRPGNEPQEDARILTFVDNVISHHFRKVIFLNNITNFTFG